MTTKRAHLTLSTAKIDDIAAHVTIKQMLKAYDDGGFGRGKGPNFKEKLKRKGTVAKDRSQG